MFPLSQHPERKPPASLAELRRVSAGCLGAEGPVISQDGRIFMVASETGWILEVLINERATQPLIHTGGIPAGLQVDHNNDLWVADMQRGILRVTLEGQLSPEVTSFMNAPMRGCNDLAFDQKGNLYFTAPAGSSATEKTGEVFCRLREGDVLRLDTGYAFSNGIALSPDDTQLLVAETFTKTIWCYDLPWPGGASNKRRWATLPGDHFGGPDGMDFDPFGNLVCANWGGGHLEVFTPQGNLKSRIALPFERPSNIHFLQDTYETTQILITEHSTHGIWIADYLPLLSAA